MRLIDADALKDKFAVPGYEYFSPGYIRDSIDEEPTIRPDAPRVMTLEEVLALEPDTPIYMQHKSGEHGWDIYRCIEDVITRDIVTGSLWAQGDCWYQKEYGKSFVFWTAKPTDEQRKAVKWDG